MIQFIIEKFKNMEKKVLKVMKIGLLFSLAVCVISCIVLFTYELFYGSPDLYYLGLSLFQSGIVFCISFIISGIAIDTIKKQMA